MNCEPITAVGDGLSKRKSAVAVRRPGGGMALRPFQVEHDAAGLPGRIKTLRNAARNAVSTFYDALHILRGEMLRLASLPPEFDVVMAMQGAGEVIGPHLQARLTPSAKDAVHGRQNAPSALRLSHFHIPVHGQEARRGQVLLCIHNGGCGQVPAHLLCRGESTSGGAGR